MGMSLGLLILRVVVGGLFVGHGTQKLFGWFGGHGPDGTGGFFEDLGYTPGRTMAIVAGACEAGAGAMLVLGLLTPLAAAIIIGVMINASLAVHADKGLWNSNGGYELPLALAAAAACLAFVGPGSVSADRLIGGPFTGYLYGAAAVALGVIVGTIVHSMRREEPAAEEEHTQQPRRAA
jgi:putative oxidoreductase